MDTRFVTRGLPLKGVAAAKRGRLHRMMSYVRGSGAGRRTLFALILLAAAGALAACGGGTSASGGSGYGGGSGAGGGSRAGGAQHGSATIMTQSTRLGTILVDGNGRTLYLFEKDHRNESACSGECAAAWPIDESTGTPKAGSGTKASLLGTTKRSDGTTQVTYNGHPLYYYSGDSRPGDLNGEGVDAFGAEWYVVSPAGGKVEGGGY